MQIDNKILKADENAAYSLRSLYRRFGYNQYKMSKFEEYALYIRNKDFLVSDGIISFTDTNGRLLALKPDVTLSIINNSQDVAGQVQKLYYDENVYRISKNSHTYKEIKQTGLECIGDVGLFELCEVVMLAIRSLETISADYILEISHVGVMESVLSELNLDNAVEKKLINEICHKSADGLAVLCNEYGLDDCIKDKLAVFIKNYNSFDDAICSLKSVCTGDKSLVQLNEFCEIINFISDFGLSQKVRVDFSLTNDMTYYSGIAFKGYIKDIPVSVLSGGQYDKLMKNMGRQSSAVGFAVYLDALERFNFEHKQFDVDVVLLHNGNVAKALKKADDISKDGKSVRICSQIPDTLTYGQLLTIEQEGNND